MVWCVWVAKALNRLKRAIRAIIKITNFLMKPPKVDKLWKTDAYITLIQYK